MSSRTERGRDVVQRTFGGALYQQGRGFYSALEFLAIVRGEVLLEQVEKDLGEQAVRVLPGCEPVIYLRSGHDHARRLLVADSEVVPGVFAGIETREAVKALLRGIEAQVPGRRRTPDKWQLRHFYPYPAEAIHYDAVERGKKISVERYQFRGAGGLAHKILRTDPDSNRLKEVRSRFRQLLGDSGTAVGRLLTVLSKYDKAPVLSPSESRSLTAVRGSAFEDEVEEKSLCAWDEGCTGATQEKPTRWMDMLRSGVHTILHRKELSDFERIDDLMHWIPWCVAQHQLAMARRRLGLDEDAPIVFDAGHKASPVRAIARKHLGEATAVIKESLLRGAEELGLPELCRGNSSWWTGPRTFYTTTLYAVGAMNAHTGQRHFELRPQFLQAAIHALVDHPLPLEQFTGEVMGERLRIICDRESASRVAPVDLDRRQLQTNGEYLVGRLDELGLLKAFSDSTRIVGIQE
jgi:hypothetical protein